MWFFKIKRIVIFSFLMISESILIYGCMYGDNRITITNKSNYEISVVYTNRMNGIQNSIDYFISNNRISPDSTGMLTKWGNKKNSWDSYIESGPEKKLYFYLFAVDTLVAYNHHESMIRLINQNKYLIKFEYSHKELVEKDWKILFKMAVKSSIQ